MRKRKWFVPVMVILSVLLIGGVTGGIVAASNGSSSAEDQTQLTDKYQVLLDRVCAIYEDNTGVAIDLEQLKHALKQARSEIRDEALENWLWDLVDEGKMTQEEVDQYLEWWRSRPDVGLPLPGLGRLGHCFKILGWHWCAPGTSAKIGG